MKPIIWDREIIPSKLFDWGIDIGKVTPAIPKARYAIPPVEWLLGPFTRDWPIWRDQVFSGYEAGAEVCTDYVRECCGFAARMHRCDPDRPRNTGLFFAEFWTDTSDSPDGVGHALCLVPVTDGRRVWPIFYDALPANTRELTREEINSCEFVRL